MTSLFRAKRMEKRNPTILRLQKFWALQLLKVNAKRRRFCVFTASCDFKQ